MKKYRIIGDLGQWLGMLMCSYGCWLLVKSNCNAGFIIITVSSIVYAISTKIKYYGSIIAGKLRKHKKIRIDELIKRDKMEQSMLNSIEII